MRHASFRGPVDGLRCLNLNSIVQLPQIVVCGDQSSGKSSVLEGITEVPFPRSDTLCTRFATEIKLRRAPTEQIRARIIPDEESSSDQKAKLEKFDESATFQGLSDIMTKATELMDLPDLRSTGEPKNKRGLKAFAKHVLSIEITGPSNPSLTVVDLPGYVHSATDKYTKKDLEFIKQLVADYMKRDRTIVLAVIAANNNSATQIVLSEVKKADPRGSRTMGVITKLDLIDGEPGNMQEMLDLAQNKDMANQFGLGWHLVRNRANKDRKISFEKRNAQEMELLDKEDFGVILPSRKGISALRKNLAKLENEALKEGLPKVRVAVEKALADRIHRLKQIGENFEDPRAQRQQLMNISRDYEKIVEPGLEGRYGHDFYKKHKADHFGETASEVVDTNLRSKARRFEVQFGVQMRKYGHQYDFPQMTDALSPSLRGTRAANELWPEYESAADEQRPMSRIEAVRWIENNLVQTRGRELPGEFDTSLLTRLFQEQSSNWEALAKEHVENVDALCTTFIDAVIDFVFPESIGSRVQAVIDRALDKRKAKAQKELSRIMKIINQPVATYDPHFGEKVEQMRRMRSRTVDLVDESDMPAMQQPAGNWFGGIKQEQVSPPKPVKQIDFNQEDRTSANRAMDALLAYYESEVEYFIKAVLKQVIEQNLLEGLAEKTLSPLLVSEMDDKEVAALMAEREDSAEERHELQLQINKLKEAQEKLRVVDYGRKRNAEDAMGASNGSMPMSKRAARRGRS